MDGESHLYIDMIHHPRPNFDSVLVPNKDCVMVSREHTQTRISTPLPIILFGNLFDIIPLRCGDTVFYYSVIGYSFVNGFIC